MKKAQIFRELGLKAKMDGANCGGEWFADSKDYITSVNPGDQVADASIIVSRPTTSQTLFYAPEPGYALAWSAGLLGLGLAAPYVPYTPSAVRLMILWMNQAWMLPISWRHGVNAL